MSTSHETEIKIPVGAFAAIRDNLLAAGAILEQPMLRESNVLLDTNDAALNQAGTALRIRIWGSRCILTFKGPATYMGPGKDREELETTVEDPDVLQSVFERLGFHPLVRYEKDREAWRLGSALITLDHTPMGNFVEIEGPAESIERDAVRLGLDPNQAVRGSYVSLWQTYRIAHNRGPHMVFDE